MLKSHGKPFMEYDIFHGLWLSPKFMPPLLGFICCMVIKHAILLWGDMNYILCVSIFGSGGQGGYFNVDGET